MAKYMIDLSTDSHYEFLGISPDASKKEIAAAADKLGNNLQKKAQQITNPDEKEKIRTQQNRLSRVKSTLSAPKKKAEYDLENVHLRYFLTRPTSVPLFHSNVDRLFVLHRVLRQFLAEKGVEIAALMDTEQTDFSDEYEDVQVLNELLNRCPDTK